MASANKEYSLAIKIAGSVSSSLNSALGTAESGLTKLGSAAAKSMKVAATAITAATAAVGAFAAKSVQVGMEFDSSMSQVAATMGTTVDEIEDLRDLAIEMGSATKFSATEAAEALNYMALAGYDAETQAAMLPTVLNLAAAGAMELSSASDMITDSQSALGLTLEETSAMVDQMAQAASKSNTSVEQLGDAILTVGGTAQYMAGGTEEINTVLGILADNGIKGSEAGTHLRNMLLKLSSPTDDAAALIDKLGVQIFDTEGNMRSFADIFPELNAAMSDMTDQEKLDAFSTLFNSRDIASATALLNTTTERWEELGDAIVNSEGAAEQMAATQLDNLEGDITLWKSALEGAQIVLSDQLTPTLREFVQFGTDGLSRVTSAFQEGGLTGAMAEFGDILSDGLDMIVGYLPTVMDAGMQLLGALGQGILDNLPTLTSAAADIVFMLIDGIVQATPELIKGGIEAIGQLAAGIASALPELIPMIMEGFTEILSALADGFASLDIGPLMEGLAEGFSNSPDGMIEAATSLITNLGSGIREAAPVLIQTVVDLGLQLLDALTSPELLTGLLQAALDIILGLAQGLISAIPRLIEAIPTIIENLIQAIVDAIPMLIEAGIQLLVSLVANLPAIIAGIIKAIPQIIVAIINGLGQLGGMLADLFSKAWEGIKNIFSGVGDFFSGVWSGIKGAFSSVGSWFKDKFTQANENTKAAWSAVGGWFSNRWEDIKGAFSSVGSWFSSTFTQANENTKAAWSAVGGWFSNRWEDIKGVFSSVGGWFKDKFLEAWENIKTVFSAVGGFFTSIWETISGIFTKIGSTIGEGISGAFKTVVNAIISFAEKTINGFINAINGAIGLINKIPGVNISLIKTLEIPRMAEGGVATGPVLAEVGEAGPEAIVPLGELWTQMQDFIGNAMVGVVDRVADTMAQVDDLSVAEKITPLADILSGLIGDDDNESEGTGNRDNGGDDDNDAMAPIYITYSPIYRFEGEAPTREDLVEAGRISQEEFNRMAAQWMKDLRRTKF